jgi:hypothetical protein
MHAQDRLWQLEFQLLAIEPEPRRPADSLAWDLGDSNRVVALHLQRVRCRCCLGAAAPFGLRRLAST